MAGIRINFKGEVTPMTIEELKDKLSYLNRFGGYMVEANLDPEVQKELEELTGQPYVPKPAFWSHGFQFTQDCKELDIYEVYEGQKNIRWGFIHEHTPFILQDNMDKFNQKTRVILKIWPRDEVTK